MMTEKRKASCLCSAIRFEVSGPVDEIGHCHCRMCQKAHGAAFGTYVSVVAGNVTLVEGAELLGRYESSPGISRTFCTRCGSTLQFIEPGGSPIAMAAGCFDDELPARVDYEIWTSSACRWGARENLPMSHPTEPDTW